MSFVSSCFQVPQEVKGYLFEYELVRIDKVEGATIRYTERVIKPAGVAFENYIETPDTEQLMQYPIRGLADSHELWQKALGRTNAYTYESNERIRKAQVAEVVDLSGQPDFRDIDELFEKLGTGSHMLEHEFVGDIAGPVDYLNKNGIPSRYWEWKHRLTGKTHRRFMNHGGKSFETGVLSKALKDLKEHQHPIAYARAQHILVLNRCSGEQNTEQDTPVSLDRKDLVAQQVCSPFPQ